MSVAQPFIARRLQLQSEGLRLFYLECRRLQERAVSGCVAWGNDSSVRPAFGDLHHISPDGSQANQEQNQVMTGSEIEGK